MMKQYPMASVPNLQSYPENGYPVQAFYGVESSLPTLQQNSPSINAAVSSGSTALSQAVLGPVDKYRQLITVFLLVVAGYALWHFYTR